MTRGMAVTSIEAMSQAMGQTLSEAMTQTSLRYGQKMPKKYMFSIILER